MTNSARVRIGKVTLKGGASLTILPDRQEKLREQCRKDLLATLDAAGKVQGWACVLWASDGSIATLNCQHSDMPSMAAPEFVKQRLLAFKTIKWAVEDINEQWGNQ